MGKFWHTNFCLMCFANLLLSFSVISVFVIYPYWDIAAGSMTALGWSVASFGAGLYLLGPCNAYLVDVFKRKSVCLTAIFVLLLTLFAYLFGAHSAWSVFLIRLVQGAAFGVFQMALGSTLLNDLSVSDFRTKADTLYAWFGRIGMGLGLFVGSYFYSLWGGGAVTWFAIVACAFAYGCICRVSVPFRTPIYLKKYSFDRFWQPEGYVLFINLLLISVALGGLLGAVHMHVAYAYWTIGLVVALLVEKHVFTNADLRSEIVCGLLLMGGGFLLLYAGMVAVNIVIPFVMLGIGCGLASSRFLLYFLKLSGHCQRGTSQHSCMLGWESGICLGYAVEKTFHWGYLSSFMCVVVALVMYLFITHPWFLKHRDRAFKFREF